MSLETRSPAILRFGTFEIDVRSGELRKRGARIRLQEQPFLVLKILLERPGEIVSREELRSQIWSADTFVDFDNSLNTAINKLREALGDSADNARFIETLPRRGYRFVGPVSGDTQKRIETTFAGRRIAHFGAVATLVAAAIGGWFWHSHHGGVLSEKDTVVVVD